jgi:hypothetical protein
MVPNARFAEMLADIEPSPTTVSNASAAHTSVRDYLAKHKGFKDFYEGSFLAGSYARDTAIRPRKVGDVMERPDVDVIVETSFDTTDTPENIITYVYDILTEKFVVERKNKRSVRIVINGTDVDVVSVVSFDRKYKLPDRDRDAWILTNPPAHNTWSGDQNIRFTGRFKPLVKLFKWWRRENKTGKRPKGFVLEVLASLHAPHNQTHYGEAFTQMLESIYANYGDLAAKQQKPTIEDPGLAGNDILSKVSITDWCAFIEKVRTHAKWARQAQNESDMAEATRLWRKLFGLRFPDTVAAAKAASPVAIVSAAAPATSYVFPDAPAAPTSNKPRGFA